MTQIECLDSANFPGDVLGERLKLRPARGQIIPSHIHLYIERWRSIAATPITAFKTPRRPDFRYVSVRQFAMRSLILPPEVRASIG